MIWGPFVALGFMDGELEQVHVPLLRGLHLPVSILDSLHATVCVQPPLPVHSAELLFDVRLTGALRYVQGYPRTCCIILVVFIALSALSGMSMFMLFALLPPVDPEGSEEGSDDLVDDGGRGEYSEVEECSLDQLRLTDGDSAVATAFEGAHGVAPSGGGVRGASVRAVSAEAGARKSRVHSVDSEAELASGSGSYVVGDAATFALDVVDSVRVGVSGLCSGAVEVVRDPEAQVTTASAASGAIALGTTGGAAGMISGAAMGALAGLGPAIFTFGLSIPIGMAIGGGSGLCVGTAVGGAVGLVGGGAVGRDAYRASQSGEEGHHGCDEESKRDIGTSQLTHAPSERRWKASRSTSRSASRSVSRGASRRAGHSPCRGRGDDRGPVHATVYEAALDTDTIRGPAVTPRRGSRPDAREATTEVVRVPARGSRHQVATEISGGATYSEAMLTHSEVGVSIDQAARRQRAYSSDI